MGALRLIGLAAFAIVGQSLARQTYLDSADLPALWALGFSRVSAENLIHVMRPGGIR